MPDKGKGDKYVSNPERTAKFADAGYLIRSNKGDNIKQRKTYRPYNRIKRKGFLHGLHLSLSAALWAKLAGAFKFVSALTTDVICFCDRCSTLFAERSVCT